jgi:hypothetical protein
LAVTTLARFVGDALHVRRQRLLLASMAVAAAIPSVAGAFAQAAERANDTRAQAAHWATANIPAGSTVVLEHLELSLRGRPWKFLFPMGEAGCIDPIQPLHNGVREDEVQRLRKESPIVDLGNVDPTRLDSCRADYAILSYYDLYRAEATRFPSQMKTYQKLLAGGRTVALFTPKPGRAGGPVVRIVALPHH